MLPLRSAWHSVGTVSPRRLVDSRETLHHAAQLLALAGASFIPEQSDDSHTSMRWMAPLGALATQPIAGRKRFRFALRVADLTLLVIDEESQQTRDRFTLAGARRASALAWIAERASEAGLDASTLRTAMHYSITPHPTDSGAVFQLPGDDSLGELARWYADANLLLEERASSMSGAGPVRCWPHHFDIATLITLPSGTRITTIGVGLSPGDASYPEPYFYIAPYPAPASTPHALSVGAWHTSEWWGAVLVGTEIVERTQGDEQAGIVRRFMLEAIDRLLALPNQEG